MRKLGVPYFTAFALLLVILFFFNKGYKELSTYSSMVKRQNVVLNCFQNLSHEINNAAVSTTELARVSKTSNQAGLFFSDSTSITNSLNQLAINVSDSLNIKSYNELKKILPAEMNWIINSNVPDSMLHKSGSPHIITFKYINELIDSGIKRTAYLFEYRKSQLDAAISKIETLIIIFAALGGLLLIYTTYNYLRQHTKTNKKEQELKTVFNRINDGVISIDKEWKYTFLNDAALSIHPLGKEETIGKAIWEIHPEIKESIFWKKYHEALDTGQVTEFENLYDPLNAWFAVKVYPSVDGLTIFFKDVTETKKAEHQLSRTLREVTDFKFALDESSIVAITDQKGIIKHVNANFCKISRYTEAELLGQDHRIINSGYHSKEYIKQLWVTIANGKIWKGELKNKAKDGTIYWVDTTIVPFLNENGKPYQYVAIRSDITERKEAEEKLVRSERIHRMIASSIPGSVICLMDTEFRYLLIEGDMLDKLGYSKEALLGNKAEDVLNPAVYKELEPRFKDCLNGKIVSREINRNGFDVMSRYIPLKDESNEVYMIMIASIDITNLKNAERRINELNKDLEQIIELRTEQLRKSNEDLEAFSYSVSHDLRAPLRGIIGFAAILEEDYGTKLDKEAERIIHVIKNNTTKMGQLIDDLLIFSKAGKKDIFKSPIESVQLVEEVIAELGRQRPLQHQIIWDIGQLPPITADLNTIRQVWINLLSNAIKYSSKKEQPCISVRGKTRIGDTVFSVCDNGVGFDETYSNKLFKVFQRLHDSEEFEGTGVGLALVDKIVSKHGGKVWARGEKNKGACFYFSIPN